jgi:hypothetical protein
MFLSDLVREELRAAPPPLSEKMLAVVSGFTVLPASDPDYWPTGMWNKVFSPPSISKIRSPGAR